MRRKTLEQYKKEAPDIPTNTCPYIDFIQEINNELKDEIDSPLITEKVDLANSMLEYVRKSNESLRESSFYWFSKFKSKFK